MHDQLHPLPPLEQPFAPASPLFFLRHGQTDWNARGLFQGRTDIPLNDRGRAQAADNARYLAGWLERHGAGVAKVTVSPLSRARETADIAVATLRALGHEVPDPEEDGRLVEQHYGAWEGLDLDRIRVLYPGTVYKRLSLVHDFAADGGESIRLVRERVCQCVAALPASTLVVGHFGTLLGILLGLWGDRLSSFPRVGQDAAYVLLDGKLLRVDRDHPDGEETGPD